MSTQLFPINVTSGLGAGKLLLTHSRGAISATLVTRTVASGTDIQCTQTAGGTAVSFWFRVGGSGTIAGNITANIRGSENNASANAGAGIQIDLYNSSGVFVSTILSDRTVPSTITEYTTSDAAKVLAAVAPTSTPYTDGEYIVVTLKVRNVGTMGQSGTSWFVTNTYNGPSGAAGDTSVTFTETLAPYVPSGSSNTNTPTAAYPFDENTGTTAHDKSGNGNDMALSVANGQVWVTGHTNSAVASSGTATGAVGSVTLPYPTTAYSVGAWIKSADSSGPLWSWENASGGIGIGIDTPAPGPYQVDSLTTNNNFTGGFPVTLSSFNHYYLVWNGTDVRYYINGGLIGAMLVGSLQTEATSVFQLADADWGNALSTAIDDLRIYTNIALTQDQVAYDMNHAIPSGSTQNETIALAITTALTVIAHPKYVAVIGLSVTTALHVTAVPKHIAVIALPVSTALNVTAVPKHIAIIALTIITALSVTAVPKRIKIIALAISTALSVTVLLKHIAVISLAIVAALSVTTFLKHILVLTLPVTMALNVTAQPRRIGIVALAVITALAVTIRVTYRPIVALVTIGALSVTAVLRHIAVIHLSIVTALAVTVLEKHYGIVALAIITALAVTAVPRYIAVIALAIVTALTVVTLLKRIKVVALAIVSALSVTLRVTYIAHVNLAVVMALSVVAVVRKPAIIALAIVSALTIVAGGQNATVHLAIVMTLLVTTLMKRVKIVPLAFQGALSVTTLVNRVALVALVVHLTFGVTPTVTRLETVGLVIQMVLSILAHVFEPGAGGLFTIGTVSSPTPVIFLGTAVGGVYVLPNLLLPDDASGFWPTLATGVTDSTAVVAAPDGTFTAVDISYPPSQQYTRSNVYTDLDIGDVATFAIWIRADFSRTLHLALEDFSSSSSSASGLGGFGPGYNLITVDTTWQKFVIRFIPNGSDSTPAFLIYQFTGDISTAHVQIWQPTLIEGPDPASPILVNSRYTLDTPSTDNLYTLDTPTTPSIYTVGTPFLVSS